MARKTRKKEAKRPAAYLLTDSAIEAVHSAARKQRCWPNRIVENLIQAELLGRRHEVATYEGQKAAASA